MRRALGSLVLLLLLLLGGGEARAQLATDALGWYWRLELAKRARWEDADFFAPVAVGTSDYAFFADKLQLGLRATRGSHEIFVQYQHSWLASLPRSVAGTGGAYFVNNLERYDQQGIWRVAWLRGRFGLGDGLASAQLGRQLFRDGLEAPLDDPTLAWLQKHRIAERLIGPFDFTHVGRSFDGAALQFDQDRLNVTAFGFVPTAGGFELDANRELHVAVGGASVTLKDLHSLPGTSARVFGLWYRDRRDLTAFDNAGLFELDTIELYTLGANLLRTFELGPGRVDLLLWGVTQFGDWQDQDHEAFAFALEAGYRLPDVWGAPWLRVGWNVGSGDSDPGDGEHETFFQLLPTSRLYAQFPFYNLMNDQDLFAQLVLEPHARVSLSASVHQLRLENAADLLYSGGGATSNRVFGYVGFPATGARGIGTLVDASLSVRPTDWLTLGAYYAHVFGRGLLAQLFTNENASYAFLEATVSY